MKTHVLLTIAIVLSAVALTGCGGEEPASQAQADARAEIEAKYGRPYEDLPAEELVLVSPHNKNIETEFSEAFSLRHALKTGKRAKLVWRDVGGGGSKVLEYLRNVYGQGDTSGIDLFWGGGEDPFMKLAAEGILQRMEIPQSFKKNVPATFNGLPMYDPQGHWAGAALGGFGILYNKTLLDRLGVAAPKTWDDLGADRFYDKVALADPMESSSAAAANEMIVQSGADWPAGWRKLLGILGNAKKYYSGASDAANAVMAEAPVATCIDFYGYMRVFKHPEMLVYVTPKGQTGFTPDPIAILKNPPHPQLAQEFVDFVLSLDGQALWCLPPGSPRGPAAKPLFRMPIRKDAYEAFGDRMIRGIDNPYAAPEMKLDLAIRKVRYGVLKHLVRAAAVNNAEGLLAAKKKLIAAGHPAELTDTFYALPPDLRTREQIAEAAEKLADDAEREKLTTAWGEFFRRKYEAILN